MSTTVKRNYEKTAPKTIDQCDITLNDLKVVAKELHLGGFKTLASIKSEEISILEKHRKALVKQDLMKRGLVRDDGTDPDFESAD